MFGDTAGVHDENGVERRRAGGITGGLGGTGGIGRGR